MHTLSLLQPFEVIPSWIGNSAHQRESISNPSWMWMPKSCQTSRGRVKTLSSSSSRMCSKTQDHLVGHAVSMVANIRISRNSRMHSNPPCAPCTNYCSCPNSPDPNSCGWLPLSDVLGIFPILWHIHWHSRNTRIASLADLAWKTSHFFLHPSGWCSLRSPWHIPGSETSPRLWKWHH